MLPERQRILLVDDEKVLLAMLRDTLLSEGYDVVTAQSGEEALALLPRVRPHLIVLDISMPGIGGLGFLKRLAEDHSASAYPVLVFTGRFGFGSFFDKVQVAGFLQKPCTSDEFIRQVKGILHPCRTTNEGLGLPDPKNSLAVHDARREDRTDDVTARRLA